MKRTSNNHKIIKGNHYIGLKYSTMQSGNNKPKIALIWLIISGLFIGFVNGFWGGGGGMICVPILINLLKLPEKTGHATTILIMLPLCVSSFAVYLLSGSVDLYMAITVGVGFVLGGIIGALLLTKFNTTGFKLIFSAVIIDGVKKMLLW